MYIFTKLIFLQLIITLVSPRCDNGFLEQPHQETAMGPIGRQLHLTCTAAQGFSKPVWTIHIPGGPQVEANTMRRLEAFADQGFVIQEVSSQTAILSINGTESNNQTVVFCRIEDDSDPLAPCQSRSVIISLYGPPSVPTNLTAENNGLGSLNISWFLYYTLDGVETSFNLNATNLNDSNIGSTIVSRIQQQYYILTVEDPSPCDVYSFQVTAVNNAGTSEPSEIITRNLPSLPDLSPVENSLHHFLAKNSETFTLNVSFRESISCSMTRYTLMVINNSSGETNMTEITTSGFNGTLWGTMTLMENSQYLYYVEVTNEYGVVMSEAMEITTTDVQSVTISRDQGDIYSIQCSYVTGSDAIGCVYILVSNKTNVNNFTGTLERTRMLVEISNIGCYLEVLAYDLERDNTTGTLPIRENINSSETCNVEPLPETTLYFTADATFVAPIQFISMYACLVGWLFVCFCLFT